MTEEWTQERIEQEYIQAQAEESTTLEYKAADALGMTDGKKREIAKDVSALANAAGGIIIYGIKEYDQKDKKHLPERLDPIDRTQFSKEWLEQVINNIRPRIDGLVIHPVPVFESTRPDNVVYIVEAPQSTTAHQAADLRYYKRYNFECLPMQDYEIRDVMNRGVKPDVDVEFSWRCIGGEMGEDLFGLGVVVRNQGLVVINHFKLEFVFPDLDRVPLTYVTAVPSDFGEQVKSEQHPATKMVEVEVMDHIAVLIKRRGGLVSVRFRSKDVLFPNDSIAISEDVSLQYVINGQIFHNRSEIPALEWILYADNMLPKEGKIPFFQLCSQC
ncbi:MAG: ATP-binding protein [Anaerolineae bacterium]|nr:ATP-binding protein [Anaerolineae bacterium]